MEIDPLSGGAAPDEIMRYVSGERRERLLRYRSDIDRKLGVYAEVLLRCMISLGWGAEYRELDIKAGNTGKPYLTGFPYCEFSISHTRNAVAAAVSDKPVGVDVERVREIDIGIAKRVFSDNELISLGDTDKDINRQFFSIWTKKEALVKYFGTGLTNNLKSLDVTDPSSRERFETYTAGDYILSICSDSDCRKIDFTEISEPELIKIWRSLTA
ncbi:MAG: 4'-phosphopantetheinyl transferase superfamily protein [Clostridiales bacterium]|nr:4'-phosphopantetheinyl transferase superfamily protein [Clostridiales bacterium]